jgi:uncharacterized protein YbjT (DUF2867 family)
MNKKKSLTDALSDPVPAPVAAEPPAPRAAHRPLSSAGRPDRAGKTNVTGYFDKPVKWELQELATELSRASGRKITLQDLLAEALNDLFKKYGKPEVARS